MVEDVEFLLPVKFRKISLSGFREEVENVSDNRRPGWTSCFLIRPKEHKLGRGRWVLAFCQVSANSVQRFQRRSWKCHSQAEGGTASLYFRSIRKTQTWQRTLSSYFLSSFGKFRYVVSEKEPKMSQTIGGRDGHLVFFFDRPEKPKLGRGRWVLASCKVLANFVQRLQRKGRKCLSQSEAGVTIMFFPIGSKNTNMVDDVEFLLPVKFQQIPFSGFRGKKTKMSQPIRGRGGHLIFPIG